MSDEVMGTGHDMFWWETEEAADQTVEHPTTSHEWDMYFLNMARNVGLLSKCASRQIGAVIVRDHRILSTGYNGAPQGVDLCQNVEGVCPRKMLDILSGEGLHICPASHAEANAIALAAASGTALDESFIYCYCEKPCVWCAGMIINAGIDVVVHLTEFRGYKDAYHPLVERMFDDAGIGCQGYTEEAVAQWVIQQQSRRPDLDLDQRNSLRDMTIRER